MHTLRPKTRTGKIARLPHKIRLELNQRLDHGQTGRVLLPWLNSHPEVRAILADQFGGRRITQQNLSEWRKGGWQDWLIEESAREHFLRIPEEARELMAQEAENPISIVESLTHWLTGRYLLATRHVNEQPSEKGFRLIRQMTRDLRTLQRLNATARALHRPKV